MNSFCWFIRYQNTRSQGHDAANRQLLLPTGRITDASGTFNELTRHSAWDRMSAAGVQLMTWFGVACELHRDWRNDVEGLGTLFSNHIPDAAPEGFRFARDIVSYAVWAYYRFA